MLELTTVGFCNFLTDTQLKNGPDLVSLLIFGSRKSLHGSNVYNFKVKRTTVSLTLSWNSNLFFWIFYSRCGFRKKTDPRPLHTCAVNCYQMSADDQLPAVMISLFSQALPPCLCQCCHFWCFNIRSDVLREISDVWCFGNKSLMLTKSLLFFQIFYYFRMKIVRLMLFKFLSSISHPRVCLVIFPNWRSSLHTVGNNTHVAHK